MATPMQLPILRARLRDSEGNYYDRDVNLSERIMDESGLVCYCY